MAEERGSWGDESETSLHADPGGFLRSRGLRVTPQRRAILGAFSGAASEHLSADEIHAIAALVVPELGRGTVYATLGELTELGILAARATPEPVRYETNTTGHQHFHCRVCRRLFDVTIPDPAMGLLATQGFVAEDVTVSAEGICAECGDYDHDLRAGANLARSRPSTDLPAGIAVSTVDTPVGVLTVAATPDGVVRIVFDNHADIPTLHDALRARRGGRAAREHLDTAVKAVGDHFAARPPRDCPIDWRPATDQETLLAVMDVPRDHTGSYEALKTSASAAERGHALGTNPLAIIVPCHRIIRGHEVPGDYVGGPEKRRALLALESA